MSPYRRSINGLHTYMSQRTRLSGKPYEREWASFWMHNLDRCLKCLSGLDAEAAVVQMLWSGGRMGRMMQHIVAKTANHARTKAVTILPPFASRNCSTLSTSATPPHQNRLSQALVLDRERRIFVRHLSSRLNRWESFGALWNYYSYEVDLITLWGSPVRNIVALSTK